MSRRLPLVSFFAGLVLALLASLLGCGGESAPASGPDSAPASAPDGQGLVILPYEGPLGRGVTTRDPRLNFHDFGRVLDGDTVTRVFEFRNSDPRDVAVTRVDPGCGCTVASLRVRKADGSVVKGESIRSKAEKLVSAAPGEVIELEVEMATRDLITKNSDKLVNVRIQTDSPNGYYLTLELHILVEQSFVLVPASLAFGSIPESGGGRGKLEIVRAGPLAYALTELLPPPEGIRAELVSEIRNGSELWTLSATLEPPLARGPLMATLRIATEEAPGVPGRDVEVPLTAMVVADFAGIPERIVFAAPRDAEKSSSTEFRSLLAGHRVRVTSVEVPEAHRAWLRASFEPVEADDDGSSPAWTIKLETVPPLPAEPMLTGKLKISMEDPQHPSHELEYVVHVR